MREEEAVEVLLVDTMGRYCCDGLPPLLGVYSLPSLTLVCNRVDRYQLEPAEEVLDRVRSNFPTDG